MRFPPHTPAKQEDKGGIYSFLKTVFPEIGYCAGRKPHMSVREKKQKPCSSTIISLIGSFRIWNSLDLFLFPLG